MIARILTVAVAIGFTSAPLDPGELDTLQHFESSNVPPGLKEAELQPSRP